MTSKFKTGFTVAFHEICLKDLKKKKGEFPRQYTNTLLAAALTWVFHSLKQKKKRKKRKHKQKIHSVISDTVNFFSRTICTQISRSFSTSKSAEASNVGSFPNGTGKQVLTLHVDQRFNAQNIHPKAIDFLWPLRTTFPDLENFPAKEAALKGNKNQGSFRWKGKREFPWCHLSRDT